jgi:hypothetical protein
MPSKLISKGLDKLFKKSESLGLLTIVQPTNVSSSKTFDFNNTTITAEVTEIPPFKALITDEKTFYKGQSLSFVIKLLCKLSDVSEIPHGSSLTVRESTWRVVGSEDASDYTKIIVIAREGS